MLDFSLASVHFMDESEKDTLNYDSFPRRQ